MFNLVIFIAALLAFARFYMPTHELSLPGAYEAFAHLFLGFLIGMWVAKKDVAYFWVITALTFVEVVAFYLARR